MWDHCKPNGSAPILGNNPKKTISGTRCYVNEWRNSWSIGNKTTGN